MSILAVAQRHATVVRTGATLTPFENLSALGRPQRPFSFVLRWGRLA
jgi:hypothetical protein